MAKGITVASRKAKGRRLQDWVRDMLLEAASFLVPTDIKCAIMGEKGEDIKLSATAKAWLPYYIECKNREQDAGLWKAYDQAGGNLPHDDRGIQPLLFLKKNGRRPIVVLDADYFIRRFICGDLHYRTEGVADKDVKRFD